MKYSQNWCDESPHSVEISIKQNESQNENVEQTPTTVVTATGTANNSQLTTNENRGRKTISIRELTFYFSGTTVRPKCKNWIERKKKAEQKQNVK